MNKRLISQVYSGLIEQGKWEEAHSAMLLWLDQTNWENKSFNKGFIAGGFGTLAALWVISSMNSRKKQAL